MLLRLLPNQVTHDNMAENVRAKALYDFEAQPGSGELSIKTNEILTVTRRDVGEGWWEGVNSQGQNGLFPADYVEIISSPPPSIPPPPLPDDYDDQSQLQQQVPYDANDDWDDDWDDDDDSVVSSQDHQSQIEGHLPVSVISNKHSEGNNFGRGTGEGGGRATVKRSYNRFSTFVKSGGEAYILGQTKITVPSEKCISILENNGQIMWAPSSSPYTCTVTSPKKETKLRGLKSFIAYQLTPSFNNIQVSRRYKHFDWLHGRLEEKFALIPIPPLPDKQISGRYQDDFIEHRMAQLQMWVNRICRHPVLSECDVWKHFLLCTHEKTWKAGKRKAEKDELVGGQFFHCISPPSADMDINNTVEKETDKFGKFVSKMDDTVRQMFNISQEQTKKHSGSYKREFQKIAGSFKDLGEAFEMDDSPLSNELTEAIKHTSSTYEEIGTMYEDQPKYDLEPLGDVLHEYKGMLASWPDVLHLQKSALIKRREYQKLCEDGKLAADELTSLDQRTDVIAYATLAEINHFHSERVAYFKSMMQTFLTAQIDFYQRIVQKLQESLVMYDNP